MITYLNGDKSLFDNVESALFYGLMKSLPSHGANSQQAYLLANERSSFFIKPADIETCQKEIIAYELAKKLGLQEYFLPVCSFEMKKNEQTITATAFPMLPDNYISLQDLEKEHEGALDGTLGELIKSGISHRIAFLDICLHNLDHHRGNLFTGNGKIVCIDHGEAFEKSDKGWIPAVLRKSDYKKGDPLPLCDNEYELRKWIDSLNFTNSFFQEKLELIKNTPGRVDAAINDWWMKQCP